MNTKTPMTRTLAKLIVAALLAGSAAAHADETLIQVAVEDGKPTAQFKMGDSRCVLKNDQIRCAPVPK
jgi:hypothetical protein